MPLRPLPFIALCAVIYLALIYSTGLHIAWGPERTVQPGRWLTEQLLPKQVQETAQRAALKEAVEAVPYWGWQAGYGDAVQYMRPAVEGRAGVAPFRYRPLVPELVAVVHRVLGMRPDIVFVLLNIAVLMAAAFLYTVILQRSFGLEPLLALVGGILFLTIVANTGTSSYPMLDPAAHLFSLLLFVFAYHHRPVAFAVTAVLAVLVKETLVVYALVWAAMYFPWRSFAWRPVVITALVGAAPVLSFLLVRYVLGSGAIEVNYGFNLLHGEFPSRYIARLTDAHALNVLLTSLVMAFGPLWLGVLKLPLDRKLLLGGLVMIPLVTLATILLSSGVARVMGVMFPFVLTPFLFYFQPPKATPAAAEAP